MSGKSSSIDPTSLTVADLKKELAKNQVQFDSKKLKQYYVDLFREKIQSVSGTVFSSDDEEEDAGKNTVSLKGCLLLTLLPCFP